MYRFVFDTDVIVAAMRTPSGASAALLGAALDRRLTMLASVPLFLSTRLNALIQCIGPLQVCPESKPTFSLAVLPPWSHRSRHITSKFFAERTKKADMEAFRAIFSRPGGEPPRIGDELG